MRYRRIFVPLPLPALFTYLSRVVFIFRARVVHWVHSSVNTPLLGKSLVHSLMCKFKIKNKKTMFSKK
uniref:Uncharacterized protein n=1 Tax=Anguilla anguilla TaxID=7936 RepID=A0A0E9WGX7_ANGAN